MSVIPLTLTISLCLMLTFVVFFLREHSRQRFSSAESDALLPLAEERPRLARSTGASASRDRSQAEHSARTPVSPRPAGDDQKHRPARPPGSASTS